MKDRILTKRKKKKELFFYNKFKFALIVNKT